jgi:hypothetical protein
MPTNSAEWYEKQLKHIYDYLDGFDLSRPDINDLTAAVTVVQAQVQWALMTPEMRSTPLVKIAEDRLSRDGHQHTADIIQFPTVKRANVDS